MAFILGILTFEWSATICTLPIHYQENRAAIFYKDAAACIQSDLIDLAVETSVIGQNAGQNTSVN
jgi:hypothetical protein